MTEDFIKTAQARRLNALTEMERRELNGEKTRKIHRLPALTPRHIDALFQTSKGAQAPNVSFLAA